MQTITNALQAALDAITGLAADFPMFGTWYTTVIRFVLPILALLILLTLIRSLIAVKHLPETWAYLSLPNGERIPLTHWENIIGRAKNADVVLSYPSVSRTHAAMNRNDRGEWTLYDLDSTGGTTVNGRKVDGDAIAKDGDVLAFGGVETVFLPVPVEEKRAERRARAEETRPVSPWGPLILLTLFQVLTAVQLIVSKGAEATVNIPLTFLGATATMWIYCLTLRAMRRVGFEMELIAFFLCTLGLAVTASAAPDDMVKIFLTMLVGLFGFLVLCTILRNLERVQTIRWVMAAGAIGLLALTLVIGTGDFGAKNWIKFGGFSIQPSEIAKICYVFAGAASLERLFKKRNLTLFIVLTGMCGGCLALMNDFGTALIFFVTFIVIAYMRSGDWATLALICSGCGIGGMMLLRLKSHVAARFAVWGHAWQDASDKGFQQVRTMSASASGGLIGVGAGNGWLKNVFAADTDLVFGMICEEFGFVIACLSILCIITLAVFAVRACRAGRSSFYTIAACAAASMMVFQTCLNVFGAVDILPLTGVTFPFVSNGGSAMLSAWGLLAFLKATDTRQNASFAVRLPSRKELRREEAMGYEED
ncbi:FtsW/RodA/SpoVE family cell cycle protein [Intestinibacillus sp. Marseille-P6563]|uniref:FtsW/RodA/SpoVE family cell cycle protein n=1 Tax=Intestinibacillus sp. Marseille-P6563 TaxID=2364792 RepID=UPI000F04E415|nr:FtsW/RodA/SpoVE family cell cycle protein [Intestinibacillus sp. Marseille-P6563]